MTRRQALAIGALVVAVGSIGWILFVGLPRWYGSRADTAPPAAPAAAVSSGRKIKARLFYVSEDGTRL